MAAVPCVDKIWEVVFADGWKFQCFIKVVDLQTR